VTCVNYCIVEWCSNIYSIVTFIVSVVEHLFLLVTNNIILKNLLNIAEMLTCFILNNAQDLCCQHRQCCSVVTEPELLGARIYRVVKYMSIFWSLFLEDQI
jgi:hypothetical protein